MMEYWNNGTMEVVLSLSLAIKIPGYQEVGIRISEYQAVEEVLA